MLELLAPAGSPDAMVAAVQNGADAVYLGLDAFNARRGAKNFTEESFAGAAAYCRVRGCKVYVTLNVLATDRDLVLTERLAKSASRMGADALIVQDLGVMRMLRQALPEMELHASTQMSVHNLDGVRRAAEAGASRVILARELSIAHIAYIAKHSPIELEVFVHGALCVAYSGQCYMSACIGGRSGNRGMCAQPCRLEYNLDGVPGAHLSLKDNCLIEHLGALEAAGVKSLKLEGRMKRPEYTAIVTKIYSDVLREKRQPTASELDRLEAAFSRQGFTDAYLRGKKGPDMFGVRTEESKRQDKLFAEARRTYIDTELPRVPVKFYALVKRGEPVQFAVSDADGRVARIEGPAPEYAQTREIERVSIEAQLMKTGGTPYYCRDVEVVLDPGLYLSVKELNEARRTLLENLTALRAKAPTHTEGLFRAGDSAPERDLPPQLNVSLLRANQLTEEFAALNPALIYMPIDEILDHEKELRPYLERLPLVPILPRVILDNEKDRLKEQLAKVQTLGITQCLVGNMGHIELARRAGLLVRGDFGFNVFNGQTLKTLGEMGLASAAASFELNLAQIRDMDKEIDLELIAYGRLPLMVTETCILQNAKGCRKCETNHAPALLADRKGITFPVVKEPGCRNVIYNSRKLFLADRAEDYMDIGLWGVRLCFTTENPRECREVLERYLCLGTSEPGEFTRGLYYRGVE